MTQSPDENRHELEDLLPWHAAGTLDRREAEKVEAALAGDPELARRYALVREELAADVHLNETAGAPSPRALDRLLERIDAEPVRRPLFDLDLGARLAGFLASLTPRTLAFAASAAALVLFVQFAALGGLVFAPKAGAPIYRTASANTPSPAQGAFVLVRFAPSASAADATAFLEKHGATIVDGPTAGGLYRVRVAPKPLAKPALAGLVRHWQSDKSLDFVAASR